MTKEQIQKAESALKMYQQMHSITVPVVSVPYKMWMDQTALGLFSPRTTTTVRLDEALKAYDASQRTALDFYKVRDAFNNWMAAHPDWQKSARNKTGIIDKLYHQIMAEQASLSIRDAKNMEKWEAMKQWRQDKKELAAFFYGHRLVFKNQVWKAKLATVLNASPQLVTATSNVRNVATSGVVPDRGKIQEVAVDILGGQDPKGIFSSLGVSGWDVFTHGLANFLKAATAPAQMLAHIYKVGKEWSSRRIVTRERFDFSPGNAQEAVDALVHLLTDELRLAVGNIGKDVMEIVTNNFLPGVGSIAETVVEFCINMKHYAIMGREMQEGNELLGKWDTLDYDSLDRVQKMKEVQDLSRSRDGLFGAYNSTELFNASPLLGCYFLRLAPVGLWLNIPVEEWFDDGFMDHMSDLYEKAQPVLKLSQRFIETSKYALSDTENLGWVPRLTKDPLRFLGTVFNSDSDKLGIADLLLANRTTTPIPGPSEDLADTASELARMQLSQLDKVA